MNWNVTDSFFDFAGLHPDAIAVIDGDRPISYCVLRNGVCLAARQFEEAGWRPGDVVGISVAGSQASHLVAALALARSGIAHVALPANEPLPLLRSRMRRAGVSALVCDSALAADTTIGVV